MYQVSIIPMLEDVINRRKLKNYIINITNFLYNIIQNLLYKNLLFKNYKIKFIIIFYIFFLKKKKRQKWTCIYLWCYKCRKDIYSYRSLG